MTGRLIYDNLFNILLMVLLLNIIFGITIDTFAELRAEKEQQKVDQYNSCTICSIDRNEFDRYTEHGFKHHINTEHNMWDYIFFLVYLINKEPTEFTGVESYVVDQVQQGSISFFPVGKAIALWDRHALEQEGTKALSASAEASKDTAGLEQRMESLEIALDNVVKTLNEMKGHLTHREDEHK